MAKDGTAKRKPLTPKQWAEMRAAFEAGESEASLSRRFVVDRKTIRSRRAREQWIPHVSAQVGKAEATTIRDRAKAQVIDIATKRAVEAAVEDGSIAAAAAAIVADVQSGLLRHAEIERHLLDLALDTVQRSIDGRLRPGVTSSEAAERKDAVAAARMAIDLSRDIAGLRPGQASDSAAARASKPTALRFLPAPKIDPLGDIAKTG